MADYISILSYVVCPKCKHGKSNIIRIFGPPPLFCSVEVYLWIISQRRHSRALIENNNNGNRHQRNRGRNLWCTVIRSSEIINYKLEWTECDSLVLLKTSLKYHSVPRLFVSNCLINVTYIRNRPVNRPGHSFIMKLILSNDKPQRNVNELVFFYHQILYDKTMTTRLINVMLLKLQVRYYSVD